MKIIKKAMNFKDAQKVIQEQTLKVGKAQGDPESIAKLAETLEVNLSALELMETSKMDATLLPSAMMVIEVEEPESPTDGVLKNINSRIDALTDSIGAIAKKVGVKKSADEGNTDGQTPDGNTNGQTPEGGDDDEALILKATGLAFTLGVELLTGYIAKLSALKAKFEATDGAVAKQDIWDAFDGKWRVEDALVDASIAMAKADGDKDLYEKAKEILLAEIATFKSDDEDDNNNDDEGNNDNNNDDTPEDVSDDDELFDLSPPLNEDK